MTELRQEGPALLVERRSAASALSLLPQPAQPTLCRLRVCSAGHGDFHCVAGSETASPYIRWRSCLHRARSWRPDDLPPACHGQRSEVLSKASVSDAVPS